MANQGLCHSRRMQGIPQEDDFNPLPLSPRNPSHKGTIHSHLETKTSNVSHPDHQTEREVEVIEEGFVSSNDLPLTNPTDPPLLKMPYLTNAIGQ